MLPVTLTRRQTLAWVLLGLGSAIAGCTKTKPKRQPAEFSNVVPIPDPQTIDVEGLRKVNAEIAQRGLRRGLGSLGLKLDGQPDQSRYDWCTPKNCRTFASTGGNGVHFSLLLLGAGKPTPAVVTNPGSGMGLSHVVGETLYEFLCLGSLRGFFALEQLQYNRDLTEMVFTDPTWVPSEKWHHSAGFVPDEEDREVLDYLTRRLSLRHWADPKRFQELDKKYAPALIHPKG